MIAPPTTTTIKKRSFLNHSHIHKSIPYEFLDVCVCVCVLATGYGG